jgi:hypothetical protein
MNSRTSSYEWRRSIGTRTWTPSPPVVFAPKSERLERLPQETCGLGDLGEADTGRVEVEQQIVGAVGAVDPRGPDVEVDAAPVDEPEERLDRVREDLRGPL